MSSNEDLPIAAVIFLNVFVGPGHSCSSIVENIIDFGLRQQSVVGSHDHQPAIPELLVNVLAASFNPSSVEPHHHWCIFQFGGIIHIQLTTLLGVGI